jgi:hypothetical protein
MLAHSTAEPVGSVVERVSSPLLVWNVTVRLAEEPDRLTTPILLRHMVFEIPGL